MSRKSNSVKTLAVALLTIAVLILPLAGLALAADPTNGIITPANGAIVSGPVDVTGYADDRRFDRWQLDVLPGGDATKAANLTVGTKVGSFTYVMDSSLFPVGDHVLRLRIVRKDSNYEEFLRDFTIDKLIVPTNGITSPADGKTVSGEVAVRGYANDPDFDRWQLDVLPGGDATATPIPLTVSDVPGYFIFPFDTTALPAGSHALRLRVVRPDGNYTESLTDLTVSAVTEPVFQAGRGDPGGLLDPTRGDPGGL